MGAASAATRVSFVAFLQLVGQLVRILGVYYRPGSFIAPATGAYAAPGQMMPQPAGAPQTVRMVPMAPTPVGMPAPLSVSSRTLGQVLRQAK
ncbi:hypothetical protein AK812_SmicGene46615, partial [Symbiodinium microadriaticum]